MIKYMCTVCNQTFESKHETHERKCPTCETDGYDHVMLSLSDLEDFESLYLDEV